MVLLLIGVTLVRLFWVVVGVLLLFDLYFWCLHLRVYCGWLLVSLISFCFDDVSWVNLVVCCVFVWIVVISLILFDWLMMLV